jgi:DNA-binding CsgD family transcriptional regulator
MFVSTKTVSANLTKIYRKLGVRNRAELSALLANERR